MTSPGWYDDPDGSGNLRYWDGQTWTEHRQAPSTPPPGGSGPGGSGAGGPPPFQPPPGVGPGSASAAPSGSLFSSRSITAWANRTQAVLTGNLQPLAILSFCIPFPFFIITYILIDQIFRGAQWSDIDDEFQGINSVMIVLAVISAIVTIIVTLTSSLATAHYSHQAFIDQTPAHWSDSLKAVAARVPKFLGFSLLYIAVIFVLIVMPIALMIYGFLAERLGLVSFGLAIPFAFILFIWLVIKLAFVPISTAVAPKGVSALASSWKMPRGRFWPMFGRLAIIYALSGVFNSVTQIVSQTLSPYVIFSGIERRDDGFGEEFLVDGQRIETLDVLPLGELLPNPLLVIIFLTLMGLAQAANQAAVTTAVAGLYVEAGGPSLGAKRP